MAPAGSCRAPRRRSASASRTTGWPRKASSARKDAGVIDETSGGLKDIDAVMHAQRDLVEIVHTLKQVVCVKG